MGHSDWLGEANNLQVPSRFLEEVKTPVFHNAKFDLQVLKRAGVPCPEDNVQDTAMMSHYVYEDVGKAGHSLENLARIYNIRRKDTKMSKALKENWDNMPVDAMGVYAAGDVVATRQLYDRLLPAYQEYAYLWEETDREFMQLLKTMEEKGMRVDLPQAQYYADLCEYRLAELRAELGFDPAKPSQLHPRLFDPPPFGYGLKPTSLTPKGKPQVDAKFLERTNHPVCGVLLEYRQLLKQVSSYFLPYLSLAATTGYLHPSFRQNGTVTGRLSCADPNLQQLPRDIETNPIKKLFLPDEGKVLIEIDYSNLEMRLMTAYSKQPALLEEFTDPNGDVHGRVAKELGIDRFRAKTVNFLIGYGGGKKVLSNQLGIPEKQAGKILDSYKQQYPELFSTSKNAERSAYNNGGVVKMWTGRCRHFNYPSEYHKAFNSVIQGGGFEIVKRACLKLHRAGFDIRNQVHDSVWLMMDKNTWKEDSKEAERIMEEGLVEEFGLPFYVESKDIHAS